MRSTRSVHIPCTACHGHGEVELPAPHRVTLLCCSYQWRDTAAISRVHAPARRPKPTALVNRLNALVRWGLVERRGTGCVEWRRI